MKQKIKINKIQLFNHLHKVKKRHVERFIHTWTHTHHTIIHMGELLIVWMIWFSSLLFANYNNSYEHLHRNTSQEIVEFLARAIQQEKPDLKKSKIISVREMDGNVNNTFAPWYCTYWAARISPEFFPYSEDKMSQERTRGGNAIDRCEGAEKAGFKIGSTPSIGSLIVYKKVGSNVTFWHVGKVMYYNKWYKSLIIRDMNWIWKFIMSDRWENSENENVKCYIYPTKIENNIKDTTEDNDKFNINDKNNTIVLVNTGSNEIKTPISKPTIQEDLIQTENNTTQEDETHDSAPEEKINIQEPENNNFYNQSININENEIIIIPNDNFSDISKHFLSQNEMKIIITNKDKINIWENILLKITVINKDTKKPYQGILPFIFNSISQNTSLEWSIETLQLIHNQENNINFKAKEKGTSTILLTIDDQKIATIPIIIN